MSDPLILLDKDSLHTGILTLNRPKVLNALSPAMLNALCNALETFDADPDIRVLIITGDKRAFAEKIVPSLHSDEFRAFRLIFDKLGKIINYLQSVETK